MGGAADPGLGYMRGGHHDMDVRSRPPIAPLPKPPPRPVPALARAADHAAIDHDVLDLIVRTSDDGLGARALDVADVRADADEQPIAGGPGEHAGPDGLVAARSGLTVSRRQRRRDEHDRQCDGRRPASRSAFSHGLPPRVVSLNRRREEGLLDAADQINSV